MEVYRDSINPRAEKRRPIGAVVGFLAVDGIEVPTGDAVDWLVEEP
jgi:hypothetical protein